MQVFLIRLGILARGRRGRMNRFGSKNAMAAQMVYRDLVGRLSGRVGTTTEHEVNGAVRYYARPAAEFGRLSVLAHWRRETTEYEGERGLRQLA